MAATECHHSHLASTSKLSTNICDLIHSANVEQAQFHGVLVQKHGETVAEQYFDGSDRIAGEWFSHGTTFNEQSLYDVRSISKSVVSLLIGIAIAQGKIESVDAPLSNWFSDHPAVKAHPQIGNITIKNLLTMSSGLDWNEDSGFILMQDQARMELSSDMVDYVLNRTMAFTPGSRYDYNSGNTILLGAILERATGMAFLDFADKYLFKPLDITHYEWTRGRNNQLLYHAGLRLSARDLAKVGKLVLHQGQINGHGVIPQNFLLDSVYPALQAEGDWHYGYAWRMGDVQTRGHTIHWIAGMGNGGQRLVIVPELDASIVLYAGRYNKSGPNNYRASNVLFEQIIKSIATVVDSPH